MAGAKKVVANMSVWEKACYLEATAAFRKHGKEAKAYAKTAKPYVNRTHASVNDIYNRTQATSRYVISSEIGYRSIPSRNGSHGYWLENPNKNVYAYGNKSRPFGEKYRIIEKACGHPIPTLMRQLQVIYGGGRRVSTVSWGFKALS